MGGAVMSLPVLKYHKSADMYFSRSTSTIETQTFDDYGQDDDYDWQIFCKNGKNKSYFVIHTYK